MYLTTLNNTCEQSLLANICKLRYELQIIANKISCSIAYFVLTLHSKAQKHERTVDHNDPSGIVPHYPRNSHLHRALHRDGAEQPKD